METVTTRCPPQRSFHKCHEPAFRPRLPNIVVRPPAVGQLTGGDLQETRILLIDGNPADVDLFRLALNGEDIHYQLSVIENGADALAFARHNGPYADTNVPDLTVLEMHLPGRDGVEVLKAMFDNPVFTHVPVVVMSSGLSPTERATLRQFQSAIYIRKPLGLDGLRKIGREVKDFLAGGRVRSQSSGSTA